MAGPVPGGWRSFITLLFIQGQNAFNDNFIKLILISLALALPPVPWLGQNPQFTLSLLIPIPFVLLAPIAGFLADRFSKRLNLRLCLASQLVLLALILWSLKVENLAVAVLGFFLLSVQTVFFGPAKQGVLKEYLGAKRLSFANGLMQMFTIVSMLAGIFLGGFLFARMREQGVGVWESAYLPTFWVTVAAIVGLALSLLLSPTKGHPEVHFTRHLAWSHFHDLRYVFTDRTMGLTALGITFFWFIAYFMGVVTVNFGVELYPDRTSGLATKDASIMSAVLGLGMIVGSILVSLLSRHRIEVGMVPPGGLGLALGLTGLGFFRQDSLAFYSCLAIMGVTGAFFIIPLAAKLQDKAGETWRGRVLGAEGLLTSVAGLVAILSGMIFTHLSIPAAWQVLVFAVPSFALAVWIVKLVPRQFFRFALLGLFRLLYRVRTRHAGRMPEKGGVLLVCNHVSYIDSFILTAASPRPVRFVIFEDFLKVKAIAWFLHLFRVIPIRPEKAKEAIAATAQALKDGDVVCIFPEGHLTRTGVVNELRKGFELIARRAGVPVLPAYLGGVWGSIFTYEGGRYFFKWPRRVPRPVTVVFGQPIPPEKISGDGLRLALNDLSALVAEEQAQNFGRLEEAIARNLKRAGNAYVEHGRERHAWSRRRLFASAMALASRWRRTLPPGEERVGVLLPAGPAAALMHLGLRLAGRIPVAAPLKMQSGGALDVDWLDRALRAHRIGTVITSRVFSQSLVALIQGGSPVRLLDMAEELSTVVTRLVGERLLAFVEPAWLTCRRLGLHRPEAGSPGQPAIAWIHDPENPSPSVPAPLTELTHRGLLSQFSQLTGANFLSSGETLFSEAQYHTVAGALLSLWYPVLERGTVVSRSFGTKIDPEKLRVALAADPVDIVVLAKMLLPQLAAVAPSTPWPADRPPRAFFFDTGLPAEEEKALEARLGLPICRGWAPESLGALVSLSLPDPNTTAVGHRYQRGRKAGTQGLLLPGIAARIGDGSGRLSEKGRLHLTGPCLPQPPPVPEAAFEASFDEEAFLSVEPVRLAKT